MANVNITGFKNIHFAPIKIADNGAVKPVYDVPVPIKGAKNAEVSLSYESITFYADDTISFNDNFFSSGEVKITVTGLSIDEYKLLFGNTEAQGGITVNANDLAVEGALLFEKKILGTNHTRKFIVYSCRFSPVSVSAETLADSVSESNVEITGSCRMLSTGEIYSFVDTNAVGYDPALDDWYGDVKFLTAPIPVALKTK